MPFEGGVGVLKVCGSPCGLKQNSGSETVRPGRTVAAIGAALQVGASGGATVTGQLPSTAAPWPSFAVNGTSSSPA